ncbi:IclR family transcriptional regulator C-terminal domain-containing protein [Streptomyces sp. H27-C3]|uniref:IclR family transcriptional regulator domain-containing protein n=1 Tax=Streptomyces sp. H27-C3 TaxID=3046305 RepID=UPI0024BB02C2|nr:IclR family transcriptional regulator C-terminal domain-containing protein [Streptomyces sp. H27-C3]MDJ0462444.1 IclR family transcriptional regulator C-terminal domain-containing protein [Streptomyces sp. H27-C3]
MRPAPNSALSTTPDTAPHTPPPAESVGPLERGLTVLRALAAPGADDRTRHSDLVRSTGLARSTVDRVVSTLDRLGLVRGDGREVALTPRALELSGAYLTACGIPAALGPEAERLADEFDESVSVAVPDAGGAGARFVLQTTRRRTMSLALRIGDLLPAERCAPGALFAARWDAAEWDAWRARRDPDPPAADFTALPPPARPQAPAAFEERAARAASDGWAGDDQLVEPGLVAVAVPVRDAAGRTVCAVSVASHTSRHTLDSLRDAVLPRLRAVRAELEAALAAPRSTPGVTAGAAGASPVTAPDTAAETSSAAKRELGPGFLQSLARGLAVLAALGADRGEGMTLTEVAGATGLARATARRSLLTLEHLGYVAANRRRFRLLPRVLELGCARLSGLGLAEIAQPHLAALAGRVHESASLAVLDGSDIHYVARVPTVRIMSVNITVGTRFPAYATSMGRVLLAGLAPETRPVLADALPALTRHTVTSRAALDAVIERAAADEHALVEQELEEGLRSLAVPVRDGSGRVVAAVNVARHAGHGTPEEMRAALLPTLHETAKLIEADLRAASSITGRT